MHQAIDFLRSEDADVVLLQEVYDGRDTSWNDPGTRSRMMLDELGYAHQDYAPAFNKIIEQLPIPEGNLILSKFPIKKQSVTFFDVPFADNFEQHRGNFATTPRNLQHVVLDVDGTGVNVFNTQGVWGEDGNDNDRRLAMGKTIAEAVRGLPRVILGGDFNVQEQTRSMAQIEDVGLRNIFKAELKSTFNLRRKTNPGFATAVVDMLFVSPDLEVVEHACPNVDVSDHLPLVATLEI